MSTSPRRHPSEERMPRGYYHALGRLTHAFADLENELAAAIMCIVHTRSAPRQKESALLLNAIIGGGRYDPLRDTIKRLYRVAKADKATIDYTDKLFSHISEIQWLRNRLHHHVTMPLKGNGYELLNSDEDTVRELDKAHSFGFSVELLHNAAHDLYLFMDAIDAVNEALEFRRAFTPPPLPSWRYKPSALVREGRKYHDSSRSPTPQP